METCSTHERAGATEVWNVEFLVLDPGKALDQAREAAIADARRKAEVRPAAGVTLGHVVSMKRHSLSRVPSGAAAQPAGTQMPIAPGENTLQATVTVASRSPVSSRLGDCPLTVARLLWSPDAQIFLPRLMLTVQYQLTRTVRAIKYITHLNSDVRISSLFLCASPSHCEPDAADPGSFRLSPCGLVRLAHGSRKFAYLRSRSLSLKLSRHKVGWNLEVRPARHPPKGGTLIIAHIKIGSDLQRRYPSDVTSKSSARRKKTQTHKFR